MIHPVSKHSSFYNFFFHPTYKNFKCALLTNVILSIATLGLWQIPFQIISCLDRKKIKKRANNSGNIPHIFQSSVANPQSVQNQRVNSTGPAEALINLVNDADEAYEKKDFQAAGLLYKRALKEYQKKSHEIPEEVLAKAAFTNYKISNLETALTLYDEAISRFQTANKRVPLYIFAQRARVLRYNADSEVTFCEAAEAYEELLDKYNSAGIKASTKVLENAAFSMAYAQGKSKRSSEVFEEVISRYEAKRKELPEKILHEAVMQNYEAEKMERANQLYLIAKKTNSGFLPISIPTLKKAIIFNTSNQNSAIAEMLFEELVKRCQNGQFPQDMLIVGANAYWANKNYAKAAEYYAEMIKLYKTANMPIEPAIYERAADTYYQMFNFAQAAQLYEETIDSYYDSNLPVPRKVFCKAAESYYNNNNLIEASILFEDVMNAYKKAGKNFPKRLFTSAGESFTRNKNFQKLSELYESEIEKDIALNIPIKQGTFQVAAFSLFLIKNYVKAAVRFEETIAAFKVSNKPIPATIFGTAAESYYYTENFTRAVQLFNEAFAKYEEANKPIPLPVMNAAAKANLKCFNYSEATRLHEKAFSLSQGKLDALSLWEDVAETFFICKRYSRAVEVYNQITEAYIAKGQAVPLGILEKQKLASAKSQLIFMTS